MWRLLGEAADALKGAKPEPSFKGKAADVSRAAHKTLQAVGNDYEKLAFNKAVARIYEFLNALAGPLTQAAEGKVDDEMLSALREASSILIHLVAPIMPHLAEECWKAIGNDGLVAEAEWPEFEASLVVESTITLPVQINGKKRGELTIGRDTDKQEAEAAALALDFVQSALDGRQPKKVIVVPQRIINVVV
jgi:leucyl-tRNA synthetase